MIMRSAEGVVKRCRESGAGVPLLYLVASCIACGADFSVTVGLSLLTVPAALAATIGYLLGIAVHWFISTRFVFSGAVAFSLSERRRQKALFFLSGLVGLTATVAIYTHLCAMRVGPAEAKLAAVLVSFSLTYLCRRYFVFRGEHAA
jgi:putative flippase GtrA